MAWVVFLRGVNVGGHNTFRPLELIRKLRALEAVNVGAAGTLVIRKAVSRAALRSEVLRRLPVHAEIMICRSGDLLRLASADPFPREGSGGSVTRYVSVLGKRPRAKPALPVWRWIEWNLRNYEEHGFGLWALERKDSGDFIGDCGLTLQEVEGSMELEIGYHVLGRERGNGYASEAGRACLDFGFRHTEYGSICSIVRPANAASRAVAVRIHANCREFMRRDRPALLYYTTRAEWTRRAREAGSAPPHDARRTRRTPEEDR